MQKYKQYAVFILFLFYLFWLMVMSFVGIGTRHLRANNYEGINNNFIPFHTVISYVFEIDHYNFDTWFYNTIGVVIIFMPLGFLLPKVFSNFNTLKSVLYFSLVMSMSIEIVQFLTRLGVLDVDDVILNLAGAAIGYLISKLI
ncbi:VanZ family protein [Rossellomorea arthrocnemi]|uniref:VanZ family protein n=1 Tax=Rossellomorea arthrocnemi TaxID=2769542 RepID=UPI0019180F8E|nr:VanZ family protein [Rossellomorea arthrocnemi]